MHKEDDDTGEISFQALPSRRSSQPRDQIQVSQLQADFLLTELPGEPHKIGERGKYKGVMAYGCRLTGRNCWTAMKTNAGVGKLKP